MYGSGKSWDNVSLSYVGKWKILGHCLFKLDAWKWKIPKILEQCLFKLDVGKWKILGQCLFVRCIEVEKNRVGHSVLFRSVRYENPENLGTMSL